MFKILVEDPFFISIYRKPAQTTQIYIHLIQVYLNHVCAFLFLYKNFFVEFVEYFALGFCLCLFALIVLLSWVCRQIFASSQKIYFFYCEKKHKRSVQNEKYQIQQEVQKIWKIWNRFFFALFIFVYFAFNSTFVESIAESINIKLMSWKFELTKEKKKEKNEDSSYWSEYFVFLFCSIHLFRLFAFCRCWTLIQCVFFQGKFSIFDSYSSDTKYVFSFVFWKIKIFNMKFSEKKNKLMSPYTKTIFFMPCLALTDITVINS